MNCINSLIIDGVVASEPHFLETSDKTEFVIDCTRYSKNSLGEEVTEHYLFDAVAFSKCPHLLKKGAGVRVVGRLKQETWEDNGVSHSKVYIVVEHIEIRK